MMLRGSKASQHQTLGPLIGCAEWTPAATLRPWKKRWRALVDRDLQYRSGQPPATAPEPKAPDFIAWHVSNRGEKAFWTKVGAAWFHRDRKGLSLQLEVVPINGRIVLRTPLDNEAREGQPGA